MSKEKKAESFQLEAEVLEKARTAAENPNLSAEQVKEEFVSFLAEYEKLLDEARFLTKISDKLEAKLNTTNEKLKEFNQELASEAESAKSQTENVLKKNKKLYQEKTKSETSKNKLQMTMVILICMLFIVILMGVYIIFGCRLGLRSGPECDETSRKAGTEETSDAPRYFDDEEEVAAPAQDEAPVPDAGDED